MGNQEGEAGLTSHRHSFLQASLTERPPSLEGVGCRFILSVQMCGWQVASVGTVIIPKQSGPHEILPWPLCDLDACFPF